MSKSHAAGWASDSPTPAQLKEFFAQIGSGRITKDRLQNFLRGVDRLEGKLEGNWFTFETTDATLVELRDSNRRLFNQDDWWLRRRFANKRGKAGRKIQIRTAPLPDSEGKSWEEQQELLSDGEFVPTTRDLVEGMISCYEATGVKPFPECYGYTRDTFVLPNGRVYVAFSFSDPHERRTSIQIGVGSPRDDPDLSFVGLACARNF